VTFNTYHITLRFNNHNTCNINLRLQSLQSLINIYLQIYPPLASWRLNLVHLPNLW
jgi:hypothetical protein